MVTVALVRVSKVTQPPLFTPDELVEPEFTVPPVQVPVPVGVRSKAIAKYTLCVLLDPQNPPPVTLPVSVPPLMFRVPLRLPVAIRLVLTSTRAVSVPG